MADVHAVGVHLHGENVQRSANIKGLLCSCFFSFPWCPIQLGSAGNSPVEKWEGHGPPEGAPRLRSTQYIRNIARIYFFSWNLCALTRYWTSMFFKMKKLRRWQIFQDSVWWASGDQIEVHDGYFDKASGKPQNRTRVEDNSSFFPSIPVPGASSSPQGAKSLNFCLWWLILL